MSLRREETFPVQGINWDYLLFSFSGRINRAKFWLGVLVYCCLSLVSWVIAFVIGWPLLTNSLGIIVSLLTFVSGLAVAAKRLHDRNRSAAWLILIYVVPYALGAIGALTLIFVAIFGRDETIIRLAIAMIAVAVALFLWAFVELGCLRGTVGPNQYGPDPLEGAL